MSADERNITVTTHLTSPAFPEVIQVPSHFSLDEVREAIHAAISKHMPACEGCVMPPSSSIIIASGEDFLYGHTLSLTNKRN